jgi:cytochrome c556
MKDGRHVVKEGSHLEDHGTPGNLTAEESEQAIAENRDAFIAIAQALREVGVSMLAAAEARNPQGLIDAGDTMDQVCEGCHLKFWYPGQNIPPFPDQAPEVDVPPAK